MKGAPMCPRCGGPVSEPSPWSSGWCCQWHGVVYPLRPAYRPVPDGLKGLLRDAVLPVWLPWPLPDGWLVTGFAGAGDDRDGTRAGVAGLSGPDPGEGFATGAPHAFVRYGHREFPLWHVEAPGRAAFAGEMLGNWLWVVLWPDTAGMLLLEPLTLRDLRDPGQDLDLPFGALSPRLPR